MMNQIRKNEKVIQFDNRFLSCNNILEITIDKENSEVVFYYNKEEDFKVKTIEFQPYEYYFIKSKIEKTFNLNFTNEKENINEKENLITKLKRSLKKWQKFFTI